MKLAIVLSQAAFAITATAQSVTTTTTTTEPLPTPSTFDLMALRSGSPIHFAPVSAAVSRLFLNLPFQGAKCNGSNNRATFHVNGTELHLYTFGYAPEQVYVDESGIVGYFRNYDAPPPNSKLAGWAIDANANLYFRGKVPIACPGAKDGAWSIWISDNDHLQGHEGCLGFTPRTLPRDNPVACEYNLS